MASFALNVKLEVCEMGKATPFPYRKAWKQSKGSIVSSNMLYKPFLVTSEDNRVIIECDNAKQAERLKVILEALIVRAAYPAEPSPDECYLAGPS